MKILHTADWHLGKRLSDHQRLAEQRSVLGEIADIAAREAIDLVLIAGDLFDTFNPSAEAEDVLYSTLKRLSAGGQRAVVAIAGNHDNPERIKAQDHFARECGIIFVGYLHTEVQPFQCDISILRSAPGFVELQLPGYAAPVRLLVTPYANELRLRTFLGLNDATLELRERLRNHWANLATTFLDEHGVNLLVAHLFVMQRDGLPPTEPDDERSILHVGGAPVIYADLIPPQVQYAALGHLHQYQVIAETPCPVVYSSSPLAYSFAEAGQVKYVVVVDAEPGQPVAYRPVALTQGKPLHRKRFTQVTDAVAWLEANPDCYTEVTIQTPTYLTSEERQQLARSHKRLVSIVPELEPDNVVDEQAGKTIDLSQSMTELFAGYFKAKKGQEPNKRVMALFQEVLNSDVV